MSYCTILGNISSKTNQKLNGQYRVQYVIFTFGECAAWVKVVIMRIPLSRITNIYQQLCLKEQIFPCWKALLVPDSAILLPLTTAAPLLMLWLGKETWDHQTDRKLEFYAGQSEEAGPWGAVGSWLRLFVFSLRLEDTSWEWTDRWKSRDCRFTDELSRDWRRVSSYVGGG